MSVIFGGISAEEGGYQIERSLRFNSADSAYLSRTPASAGNRKTWTWSGWVKRGKLDVQQGLLEGWGGSTNLTSANISASNVFNFQLYINPTYNTVWSSAAVFRDPSAWYHIVFVLDTTQASQSNMVKLYVNGVQQTLSYTNYNSAIPQNSDWYVNATVVQRIGAYNGLANYLDAYLAELNFIDGQALDPTSFGEYNTDTGVWQPIAYAGTYGTNGFYLNFSDNSAATPAGLGKDYSGMAGNIIVGTSTSGSTTLSVVSLTGISVGNIVTGPGIPDNTYVVSTGALSVTLSQAATSSNTSTNYTFSGNNWSPFNLSVTAGAGNDSLVDTPTPYGTDTGVGGEVRGNYATLNPLNKAPSDVVLSNGNLEAASSFTGDHRCFAATFQVTSGKWYWEVQYATGTINAGSNIVGIFNLPTPDTANNRRPADSINNGIGIRQDGQYESDNSTAAYFGSSISVGDIIGVALDADAGTVKFNVNGGSFGSTLTFVSAGGVYTPGGDIRASSGTPKTIHNFGQRPFAYTAPSGFKALCTTNLPDPAIADGGLYMNPVIYTGNSSGASVTGVGFQPDLVWMKCRSTARNHELIDVVRGGSSTLFSNLTNAQATDQRISSFDSDGFTYTVNSNSANTGDTYVAWNWKAGGTGVSNTAGTITSTVSANTTAGFSIVTYTGNSTAGATIGHGLGVAPSMIIVKSRTYAATSWCVSHIGYPTTQTLYLDSTSAVLTRDRITARGAATFTVGSHAEVNDTGDTYVAYCFAPVEGYSAFGSYVGNGSADGPFVYTGFRPKYLLIKSSSASATNWVVQDTTRFTYNLVDDGILANTSAAEYSSGYDVDILSNGFKIRRSGGDTNASSATYIYAAFAENPFKYSLAR